MLRLGFGTFQIGANFSAAYKRADNIWSNFFRQFLSSVWLTSHFALTSGKHCLTTDQSEQLSCFHEFSVNSAQLTITLQDDVFGFAEVVLPLWIISLVRPPAPTPSFCQGLHLEQGLMPTKKLKMADQRLENPLFDQVIVVLLRVGSKGKLFFLVHCLSREGSHFKMLIFPVVHF